ncbi:MAG: hypothetical protein WCX46_02320 [Candidatus Paceibacterota bacterium]
MFKKNYFFIIFCLTFILGIFNISTVFASEINGTINTINKYAWGENIGWVNFGLSNGNVQISDIALTGYAWNENYGWINLNVNNLAGGSVTNDAEGNLGGNAWGEKLGWISFSGVTIDEDGYFSGYATIESDNSRISFNCSNTNSCNSSDYKVSTDWRPLSTRTHPTTTGSRQKFPVIFPTLIQELTVTTTTITTTESEIPIEIPIKIPAQIDNLIVKEKITNDIPSVSSSKFISKITGDVISVEKCNLFISPNNKKKNICTTCDTFISPSILEQNICKKENAPIVTEIVKPISIVENVSNITNYIKTNIIKPVINKVLYIYNIIKVNILFWWQKVVIYFLS